jgi:stage V sporulation protein G
VVITEVRIKLMEDNNERLLAFCSVTFDDAFVVRDLKIIEGAKGSFVAMPSRKLTDRCVQCGCKNHLRARFCNQCGQKLNEERALRDADGRAKLHADIAHPINSACREVIQGAILKAYREEKERAKLPGYVSRYDDLDGADDSYGTLVGELSAPARNNAPSYRTHIAHEARAAHLGRKAASDADSPVASGDEGRAEGFGAGLL